MLLELGVRVGYFFLVHDASHDQYERDDIIPYEFPPNSDFLCAQTPTRTNNLGLRGDGNITIEKPKGKTRILCLGDSVTFGYCASGNEGSYPAQLESILNQKGYAVEVINGGMPRFRAQHATVFLGRKLIRLKPDLIIFLGGWNNANDQILLKDRSGWREWLQTNCYTVRWISSWSFLPQLGKRKRVEARIDESGLTKYEQALREIRTLGRQNDCETIFCTLPHFFRNLDNGSAEEKSFQFAPAGNVEQVISAIDRMNEILTRVSADQSPIRLTEVNQARWFGDAIHPNEEGCQRIAGIVANYLIKSGLVSK